MAAAEADATALPDDVLCDRVELGWYCTLPGLAADDADAFCGRLRAAGVLGACRTRNSLGRRLPVSMAVPLADGASLSVGGSLVLSPGVGGGLAVGGGSSLRPELMRAARAASPDPGQMASDGADNLVGPCGGGWRGLLAMQLAAADLLVAFLARALAGSCGVPVDALRGELWVKQAELCRDVADPDAAGTAEELSARPLPGAAQRRSRREALVDGCPVCVSWSTGARRAPVMKVYAKRPDLLRHEVCLRRREAVLAVHRRSGGRPIRCSLAGGGLGGLLADLSSGAAPLLDGILQTSAEAAGASGDVADISAFEADLSPLLAAAEVGVVDASAPGRRAGGRARSEARTALIGLVSNGAFDARGMSSSSATLRALRAMAAAGTLRAEAARPRLFSVAPQHEAARRAMASFSAEEGACR